MFTARLVNRIRQVTIAALVIYWILLFVGTHLPLPKQIIIETSDKWIHFLAYAGLAGLATLVIGWRSRGGIRAWHLALIAISLAAFAGFDELTQPFVNRQADWLDWFADIGGIVIGVVAGAITFRFVRLDQPEVNGNVIESKP